jgi:hypothetical protein
MKIASHARAGVTSLKLLAPPILFAVGMLTACGGGSSGGGTFFPVTPVAGGGDVTPVADPPALKVLSNRPDLISGGDALVEVTFPDASTARTVSVMLGDKDISGSFAQRPNGRYIGLVEGMAAGDNVVTAKLASGAGASVTIRNHPNGGPVFSGPQLMPWPCQPGALDAQCNRPTTYAFQYRTKAGTFAPYDPSSPPSDVAITTTDTGEVVPYIVRTEFGNQNRDQYAIAVLFDPVKPWTPWAPQHGWNGKVLVTHGAGCGGHYGEANPAEDGPSGPALPSVLNDKGLSRGFAVMTSALINSNHNCNVAVQAESLMMVKEHFVEAYGPIRYTIGTGGSGGALAQYQIANAYPGLYQGITVSAVYQDAWSASMDSEDCPLMQQYLENTAGWGPGIAWTAAQQAATTGKTGPTVCPILAHVEQIFANFVPTVVDPIPTQFGLLGFQNCGLSADQAFDPVKNPDGPRCTLQDRAVTLFGKRSMDRYANRALDNVGVQYGLKALLAGVISPAQFLDLNSKVGSHDINYTWQAGRVSADADALPRVYATGAVNVSNNLNQVAIIDMPGGNYDAHEEFRSFAARARMDREYGNHDNQVIWDTVDANYPDPIPTMDRWLSAIERDSSKSPLPVKIAANKPIDIIDICSSTGPDGFCRSMAGGQSTRQAAGGPATSDVIKCALKPMSQSDYGTVQFTNDQWTTLQQTFPTGVCDWSKPGVGQMKTTPWQTYQQADGHVIYGGTAMASPAAGSRDGWGAPAFLY